jgi:arabinofuranosyltransferase
MSGRFFSAALLISVVLLIRSLAKVEIKQKAVILGFIVFLGFLSPNPAINYPKLIDRDPVTGIQDMQAWFRDYSWLMDWGRTNRLPSHEWVDEGLALKESGKKVYVGAGAGYLGYYAGPSVYIVDFWVLSDPLRARLPVEDNINWNIGHFRRASPQGYLPSLDAGENLIENPDLAEFYDHMLVIVRGDLWSAERWQAIWKMNTGQYDDLITKFLQRNN